MIDTAFAWDVAVMAATYRKDGGCNPQAVSMVFPEGPDGPIDEDALREVLHNFQAWHELD